MNYSESSLVASRLRKDFQTRPRTVRFPMTPSGDNSLPNHGGGKFGAGGKDGLLELGAKLGKLEARVQRTLHHEAKGRSLGLSMSTAHLIATPNRSSRRRVAKDELGGRVSLTKGLGYKVDSSLTGKLPRKGGPRSINPLTQPTAKQKVPNVESSRVQQFSDERLQHFVDGYEREVRSFASVALHAEVKLNQLELLGPMPNKLALAVSMDVLRRLGEVGGRYQHLLARIHDSIVPHCYKSLAESSSIPEVASKHIENETKADAGSKAPSSLSGYLRQDAVFDYVERTKRENIKIMNELEKMKKDHLHSLRLVEDPTKTELVRQALQSDGPFSNQHLREAVSSNPRAAIMNVWDKVWPTADPATGAGHIKAMLSVPFKKNGKTAKQEFLNEVMLHLWNKNPTFIDGAISPRRKMRGELLEEKDDGGPETAHTLDEKIFGWLLEKQRQQICTDLVDLLKTNIDTDLIVVAEVPLDGRQSGSRLTSRRAALEKFLLGAGEEDISLLRTMVLTWDFQNGVEWKLITDADREAEQKRLEDEDFERRRLAAEEAARKAELAHKAIFLLKANAAGKIAGKLKKKKKLAAMMAKFRAAALTTVRMGSVLDGVRETRMLLGPKDKNFQVNASDIKKEVARHLREQQRKAGKASAYSWTSLLEEEIMMSVAHSGNSKKKGKKLLFSRNCLPKEYAAQITSFRMEFKDIKRMHSKKPPALLRIASDIFVLHASSFKSKQERPWGYNGKGQSEQISLQQDTLFAKTVYIYFLEKYGLPEIADANMIGLASALVKYRDDHPRLDAFARMCFNEVNEHVAMGYAIGICLLANASKAEGSIPEEGTSQRRNSTKKSASPKANQRKRNRSIGNDRSSSPTRRGSSKAPKIKSRTKKENTIQIPVSATWRVSVSAVKAAMAVTMRSVRKKTWKDFLVEILQSSTEETLTSLGEEKESVGESTTPASPKAKRKNAAGASRSSVSKLRVVTQFARGKLQKKLGGKVKAQHYSISKKDHLRFLPADVVLEVFLKHWSNDLNEKEEHLAHLFTSADIDGDGELTASEFTALVHSVDPEFPVAAAVDMYRSALRQSENESIDPEVFVQVCYETGLIHKAWRRHNSLLDVANGIEELQATWSVSEPFVMGTLRALERDLPPDHPLRTIEEAGDGSLQDLRMQLDNFYRFASNPDTVPLAWHAYWLLVKKADEAAAEGPGIQTLYGNDLPGALQDRKDAPPLAPRNTKATPHKQRRRRNGLPFILMPDVKRISGTTAPWGPSGAERKEDYIFPTSLGNLRDRSMENEV